MLVCVRASTMPLMQHWLKTTGLHLGLLAVFAILLALAFPHPGWWPLVYVALIPFGLLTIWSRRTLTLMWTTLVVSQVWWMVMLGWLSMVTFGGMTALALAMAAYWTLAAVMTNAIHRRWPQLPMTLLLPAVWMTVELVRSTWPTGGFSWFCLAHAIMPWKPEHGVSHLAQIADIVAQYGVSFLIAMPAGAVVDWINARVSKRALSQGQDQQFKIGSLTVRASSKSFLVDAMTALTLFAFLMIYANGSGRLLDFEMSRLSYGPIIGIVQTNVPQSNKNRPTFETDQAMWDELVKLTMQVVAREPRPEVVVWPETCVPAALNEEGIASAWEIVQQWRGVTPAMLQQLTAEEREHYGKMAERFGVTLNELPKYLSDWYTFKATRSDALGQIAAQLDVELIVGAPTVVSMRPSERYNSAYYVSSEPAAVAARQLTSAHFRGRFDKMHRVPFGEYLPWVEQVPALKQWFITYLTPHDNDYTLTAGAGPVVFEVATDQGLMAVVTPICYEDAFPRVCRRLVFDTSTGQRQAQIMINLTNDGWYPGTAQGPQHMQLATLRSIETRTPMVRSVNTGVSGFINAVGGIEQLVITDGKFQEVTGTASRAVVLSEISTWYGRNGLWPAWLIAMVVGGLYVEAVVASVRLGQKAKAPRG